MPGTPPVTPRFNLPRYSQSDDAIFATQVNAVSDIIDGAAKLSDLSAETARAEAAESGEAALRAGADTTETANRAAALAAEAALRVAGDTFQLVHVVNWTDQDSPTQPAGSVIGAVPAPALYGQTLALLGVASFCASVGSPPTVFKVQTDHGRGDGSLQDVTGLTAITPATGRYVEVDAMLAGTPTPLVLNRLDKVVVTLVTPGLSKGCSLALLFARSVP